MVLWRYRLAKKLIAACPSVWHSLRFPLTGPAYLGEAIGPLSGRMVLLDRSRARSDRDEFASGHHQRPHRLEQNQDTSHLLVSPSSADRSLAHVDLPVLVKHPDVHLGEIDHTLLAQNARVGNHHVELNSIRLQPLSNLQ